VAYDSKTAEASLRLS